MAFQVKDPTRLLTCALQCRCEIYYFNNPTSEHTTSHNPFQVGYFPNHTSCLRTKQLLPVGQASCGEDCMLLATLIEPPLYQGSGFRA